MKKFAIAATCLLLLTPAAWAGAYVGASVGQTDVSAAGAGTDDTSWKIVGGYNFMKYVGIEGSYRNMFSVSETIGTTSLGFDASSLDVFGVGILPIGSKFELFAKAGMSFVELDATINDPLFQTPLDASTSESDLAYGAGVNFKIGQKAAIRAEYETIDSSGSLDMISAGGVFRF